MLDFGRADAECEGAKCADRSGVTIAARNRHTGKCKSLFWPDDMDNALAGIIY